MENTKYHPNLPTLVACALAALAMLDFTANSAHAATMSASATAPAINGADIANYGTVTGTDKWFVENSGAGAAKGQTFTNGNYPVLLKAVTYQVTASQKAEPTKQYMIRVGTVSGTSFNVVYSETATQTFTWNGGEYMTWRFATPVLLTSNTTYGVDVGMTSSTSIWQTGIPYINYTANAYTGGQLYSSGTSGVGTNTIALASTDRTFHLDMEDPLRPSPEDGASVPAGPVQLSWQNRTPNVGSDVWVDVWFGTNAGALTKVVNAGLNVTNTTVTAPGAATYYWRVDSYLNGAPTGNPVASKLFTFVVFDSDSDGLPDWYELANTTPPSATALTPGGDDDSDGLTNLDEYQRGTRANLADTDGDTLNDGAEVAGAGARPPTSPLLTDTDGDGISDLAESNTGVWVSAANRGTNPTKTDTDTDGLSDGAESNTGSFTNATNTGSSPLVRDTDSDGAEDWYEVAASYTNPNNAGSKPNIPYPLPKPDSSTGVTNKPVKVFILSGQSNMVGFGSVDPTNTPGTLSTIVKQQGKFPNLLATNGSWAVHSNVWYRSVISELDNAPLKVGQGGGTAIGPELGFGHVMGWYLDEPVLLIKSSIGNRSLLWDCLPPGSPSFNYGGSTYAGYGQSPNTWPTNGSPSPFVWYAGKQYDDFFLAETNMGAPAWVIGTTYTTNQYARHNGVIYTHKSVPPNVADASSEPGVGASWTSFWTVYSVFNVVDILDNWAAQYPNWATQGFEIAGYVWFQGNKDLGEPAASRYETNLVNFIRHLRGYYANRYPGKCTTNTPFVLATGCGDPQTNGVGLKVAQAQLAVNNSTNYPQFVGNVKAMDTRGYWRDASVSPSGVGYHYNFNSETYMLTGDALGRGMIELLGGTTPAPTNDYSSWATNYPGASLADPNGDADGDGLNNNYERIWGLNPTNALSKNPFTFNSGLAAGNFNYTRRDPALTGLSYTIWTSTNLVNWAQDAGAIQSPGAAVNQIQNVSVTVSPGLLAGPQLFMRVRAQ